jgi:hypothetical protein
LGDLGIDGNKMEKDPKETALIMWIELIWLKIGTSEELF